MLRTLRQRSILSHILPVAIIVPLMGMALIHMLESQVLLPSLTTDLRGQALLAAQNAQRLPDVWQDATQARALVAEIAQSVEARVMLLDPKGRLLASSDPADADRLGQQLQIAGWATVAAGEASTHTAYSQSTQEEIVDALVPVMGQDRQVVGVVRLSHRLATVYEQFVRLRYLIAGIMAGGLLLGAVAGWLLALNLEHPLQQVNQAVSQLTSGERSTPLPERGPQELAQLAHSVNTLVERLHILEQARRQLLSNLVHELGRPLGALRSAVQALLGRSGGDAALRQELLVGIDEEINRLQRLLDDLVGLHEQALGTLELRRQPTGMSEWLTHTLGPWREATRAKGLHWQASVPDTLPSLEVDGDRLAQALSNLLSNAIKYTPPAGTVSVSAGVEEDAVWIRVSDTGPGIAPEEQERIFAPFYRSQADRRFPQGMGLGLSIAQALIAAHGGWLELESTPGMGSHFTIWIPLSPQER
jgi:two-component system sensor histidine kinase BaeS